jgi:hypothetical protein
MISSAAPAPPRRATTKIAAAALIAAALAAAGCASVKSQTAEEVVARRADERWQALIKHDFATAYTYTQPGYRAIAKQDDYAKIFGSAGEWKAAEIFETTCEPERCTVRLRLTTRVLMPKFSQSIPEIKGIIDETWVKDEGQWWYYQAR